MSGGNLRITPTSSEASSSTLQRNHGTSNISPASSSSGVNTESKAVPFPSAPSNHTHQPSVPELRAILNNVTPSQHDITPPILSSSSANSNPHVRSGDIVMNTISGASSSSNLGIRTRHRSGTLPSRLTTGVAGLAKPSTRSFVNESAPPRAGQPSLRQSSIWLSEASIPESASSNQSSQFFNTPRVRSYSANNALLTPADRQFLNQCSTIREEYPPSLASIDNVALNSRQADLASHGLHQPTLPISSLQQQSSSLLRPRSQTLGFQPYFGGYESAQMGTTIPSTDMLLNGLQRRTQSFSETSQGQPEYISNGQPVPNGRTFTESGAFRTIKPILRDNLPEKAISITSTHTNPSLGPTDTLLIINVPRDSSLTNAANFYRMMSQFGTILSVRVILCTDSSDLVVVVQFDSIESATHCRAKMNYQELIPGLSCIIAFAKIIYVDDGNAFHSFDQQSSQFSIPHQQKSVQPQKQLQIPRSSASSSVSSTMMPFGSAHNNSFSKNHPSEEEPEDKTINMVYPRFSKICQMIEAGNTSLSSAESSHLSILVSHAMRYNSTREFGLGKLPEQLSIRKFDTPRLREIRKQLDGNQLSRLKVEELALAMYEELPELASDYLGNTIVQKLMDICSPTVRDVMIKHLAPYLAQMGAHKNGTWAAQKMINTVVSDREKWIISEALSKYCTQLFNDQYANYVVHGVLKFGKPYNDFITETIMATFMEISRSRFGARAVRTCLESDAISKESTVAICACILTWCWELMMDPNGSLLITWFLDTCTAVSNRHNLLAKVICESDILSATEEHTGDSSEEAQSGGNSFVSAEVKELGLDLNDNFASVSNSRLCQVCCSKLGQLSILKLMAYRTDLKARNMFLRKIFGDTILESKSTDSNFAEHSYLVRILTDASMEGSTFICKVISIPTLDFELRTRLIHCIRAVLQSHNMTGAHQNKRLCEEVGIKVNPRSASSGRRRKTRSRSGSASAILSGLGALPNNNLTPSISLDSAQQLSSRNRFGSSQLQQGSVYPFSTSSSNSASVNSASFEVPNMPSVNGFLQNTFSPTANSRNGRFPDNGLLGGKGDGLVAVGTNGSTGNSGAKISSSRDYDILLNSRFDRLSLNGNTNGNNDMMIASQTYHGQGQLESNGTPTGQQLFY